MYIKPFNISIIIKYSALILCCYFTFATTASAMIGEVNIDQFVWYHYAIISGFALGLIIPLTRSLTVSVLIALIALYAVVEMLIAFDFVSAEWPRAED